MEGRNTMKHMVFGIVFLFSLSIFIATVFLILHFPKRKIYPQIFANTFSHKDIAMDFMQYRQRMLETIQLKYPQIPILFEDISCETCFMLRFKGLTKEKKSVVYILHKDDAKLAFFAAVEQFIEEAKTPKYGLVIAIPYTYSANKKIVSTLQEKRIALQFVYTDEAEMMQLTSIPETSAILARGRKPYAVFEVSHDNTEYDWLGDINQTISFDPVFSQDAYPCVSSCKDLLSRDMQFALHVFPLFKKAIMEETLEKIPESTRWFLPVIDKQDTKLIIYASNVQQLESACQCLQKSAVQANVTLKQVYKNTKTYAMDMQDEDLMRIAESIRSTLHIEHVIPTLLESNVEYPSEVPIISFAPLMQNTLLNTNAAIQFYMQLFALHKIKRV